MLTFLLADPRAAFLQQDHLDNLNSLSQSKIESLLRVPETDLEALTKLPPLQPVATYKPDTVRKTSSIVSLSYDDPSNPIPAPLERVSKTTTFLQDLNTMSRAEAKRAWVEAERRKASAAVLNLTGESPNPLNRLDLPTEISEDPPHPPHHPSLATRAEKGGGQDPVRPGTPRPDTPWPRVDERILQQVAELKAARRAEIERRCMLLSPPITAGVLAHMPSFQAAIQIAQPLGTGTWESLEPRLLLQREEAEQRENDPIYQELVAMNRLEEPDSEDLVGIGWARRSQLATSYPDAASTQPNRRR